MPGEISNLNMTYKDYKEMCRSLSKPFQEAAFPDNAKFIDHASMVYYGCSGSPLLVKNSDYNSDVKDFVVGVNSQLDKDNHGLAVHFDHVREIIKKATKKLDDEFKPSIFNPFCHSSPQLVWMYGKLQGVTIPSKLQDGRIVLTL